MSVPKYKCPEAIPTACLLYTGKEFTFLRDDDELACDAKLDDVFSKIDEYLTELVDGNDLRELDKKYLVFDPATIDIKGLHQIEINALDVLNGQVTTLTTTINNLNIGDEVVTVDLGAMAADASDCVIATNQYQLKAVLQLFANKLNDFETRISNLEA